MDWVDAVSASARGAAVGGRRLRGRAASQERLGVPVGYGYQVTYAQEGIQVDGMPLAVDLVRAHHDRVKRPGIILRPLGHILPPKCRSRGRPEHLTLDITSHSSPRSEPADFQPC
jgi:hypothetical protein